MIDIKVIASSSKGNAYLVSDGVTSLLLECGIRFKSLRKVLGFNISGLAGCLLTHEHMDHAKSAKELMRAGVDVHASTGTFDALGLTGHRRKDVKPLKLLEIGTWKIMPFQTFHDSAEPLGFLLANGHEKLLFATDTAYINHKFKGLTHVMIECNYCPDILQKNIDSGSITVAQKNRLLFSHFSIDNVVEFLGANDLSLLKGIYLMHLSDGNSDERLFVDRVQSVTGTPTFACSERND